MVRAGKWAVSNSSTGFGGKQILRGWPIRARDGLIGFSGAARVGRKGRGMILTRSPSSRRLLACTLAATMALIFGAPAFAAQPAEKPAKTATKPAAKKQVA